MTGADAKKSIPLQISLQSDCLSTHTRSPLGMPSFAKDLDAALVRLIQAYVVDEAQRASNPSRVRP